MKKGILMIAALVLFVGSLVTHVSAQQSQRTVHFFWSSTCPHCEKEKEFLPTLFEIYPDLKVYTYEVTTSRENSALLLAVQREFAIQSAGVPLTIIGKSHFVGFRDGYTDVQIRQAIDEYLTTATGDVMPLLRQEYHAKPLLMVKSTDEEQQQALPPSRQESYGVETISIPFIGRVPLQSLSLPVLTVVVGLLDGFNPCAMWTLLFLISILLGMKDKKRMWLLGGAFIVTSGIIYFLFMAAWLNAFLLLGYITWVRVIIGILALGAGAYYLRDWWTNKEGGCTAVRDTKRHKVFAKIKTIVNKQKLLLALTGIIMLAVTVNIVELVCSAGLPAIYTQVLTLSKLPTWQYYAYLTVYTVLFMFDDMVIFTIAMLTLQSVGIQGKYSRMSRLVGGVVMVLLGTLLLFRPELLM